MNILIVDSDEKALTDHLDGLGHELQKADSAASALEYLQGDPDSFDTLVIEANLKDGTGNDLIDKIREISQTIHIILMSAEAVSSDMLMFFDDLFLHYHLKGASHVDIDALLADIEAEF